MHTNLTALGGGSGIVYPPLETWRRDALDSRLTNYAAFVGITILVWDHIITFGDEIRYIWRGEKKSLLVYLFLINRYFTPLGFIGNLVAYFSDWSPQVSAAVVIAIEISALMMLIRVRAIYIGYPKVTIAVALILVAETAVHAWLLTHGQPVEHGPFVHACTMIFDPNLRFLPSLSAWIPLVYDTIVIVLTLAKFLQPDLELAPVPNVTDGNHTHPPLQPSQMNMEVAYNDGERTDGVGMVMVKSKKRNAKPERRRTSHIVRTLVKDGLMYYSVIFGVNLALAVMIVAASDGIKNIAAQLEQLLTVAMMSRITLNLRREADRPCSGYSRNMMSMPISVHNTQPGAPEPTDTPQQSAVGKLSKSGFRFARVRASRRGHRQGRGFDRSYAASLESIDTEMNKWEVASGRAGGSGRGSVGDYERDEDALERLGKESSELRFGNSEGEEKEGQAETFAACAQDTSSFDVHGELQVSDTLGTADIHFDARSSPSLRTVTPTSTSRVPQRPSSNASLRPSTPSSRLTTIRPNSMSVAEGCTRFLHKFQQIGEQDAGGHGDASVHELRKMRASSPV